MAKRNKVFIDIEVNGKMQKVAVDAKKVSAELDKVGKSARTTDRNLKGAAQTSSNTTKNFSKMAQGTGGLVAAYATLAANIFAISAAYNFLKNAGDLRVLRESQLNYAKTTGKSLDLLTSKIQAATGGLLAFEEAAQAVSIGTAAGLSGSQLEGLASVAKKASMALGRDLTDSFNRLTRGAIKAEPELLDELGIIIRLDKVTKDYARTLNKSAKDLTTFQKTQAVVNAVLEQGETKFADLGGEVNQIAKLGKAFTDVVNSIKDAIAPLAEFIGGALANNIYALAGAFALLGTGIAKGLGGVGPSMMNLSKDAAASRATLQGAAGTSVVGQRLASGAELSDKDLNYIESSAKAKSSTVIKYDNISREAVVRNVRIMKAERSLQLAQTQTGVKRVYAVWRAELKILQATHGTTMGFMKAGMRGFGRVANSVLGAAGAIGLLFTAIGLVKQLVDSFKSDEMKKFLENINTLNDRLDDQLSKTKVITDNLTKQKNAADGILQAFQASSNITFSNLEGFSFKEAESSNWDKNLVDRNIAARETAEKLAANLEQQINILKASGADTTELDNNLKDINQGISDMVSNKLYATAPEERVKAYNAAVVVLNSTIQKLKKNNEKSLEPLKKQNNALLGLVQTGDELVQIQDKLGQTQSKYTNSMKILQDFSTGLKDSGLRSFADLDESSQNALQGLFTETIAKSAKLSDIILDLEGRRSAILKIEADVLLNQTKLKTKYINLIRGSTPLQVADFNRQKQIEQIQGEINKILGERTVLEIMNADLSDTKSRQEKESLLNLQAQLATAKELNNETAQIGQAFKKGFEGSMTTTLADLIKGNEGSLKMAMMKIAKGALEAVANKLSEQMSLKITDFIFGKDPNLLAQEENTRAIKENTAALTGQFAPNAGSQMPTSVADIVLGKGDDTGASPKKRKGMFSYLFGEKSEVTIGEPGQTMSGSKMGAGNYARQADVRQGGIFGDFIASIQDLFSGASPFLEGLKNVFKGGLDGFGSLFKDIFGGLFGGGAGGEGGFFGFLGSMFGARNGGVFSGGRKMQGYASGGIARGSTSGYPAVLHGTEAVVPLPKGGKIPVEMKGAGTQNNITVNVSTDGQTRKEGSTGPDMDALGVAVASAVQVELQNQKRSGGILNPYGVA